MFLELIAQYSQHPGAHQPTIGGGYLLLIIGTAVVSMIASGMLKSKFRKYSQVPISMTGAQVAEMMLRQNGITDVRVISTPGQLTDHYNPADKTVNLSEAVYAQNNVAAAAVAAHECGHAVQHQQAYAWLEFRSKMVPVTMAASKLLNILMMLLLFGAFVFVAKIPILIYIFLGAMAVTTLFSIVTLPVEFDASKRALVWLDRSGAVRGMEHGQAKDALFWAAMTYVVAALAAIAQLAYWAMMLLGRRD